MRARRRARDERGVTMVMTALVLVPLMIFAAFGVDLASWHARVSYLQKAADAAALAGTVWMPDLAKATTTAKASLRTNGIVDKDEGGTDDIDVVVERGSRETALRVRVTDNSATQYFSQVFSGTQTLSRSAEAEYNLPIPLGSPLNYFGGDASKTNTQQVASPPDYSSVVPLNYGCNIGTSSSQGLGRWDRDRRGDPSWDGDGHSNGDGQCEWGAIGTETSGSSGAPPPDYRSRRPIDGRGAGGERPCNVFGTDPASPLSGRWSGGGNGSYRDDQNYTGNGGSGGNRQCVWENMTTTGLPSFATTTPPSNGPCNIGYTDVAGRWTAAGSFEASQRYTGRWRDGNILCRWSVQIVAANPIDPNRSPGLWAQIHGPGADQQSGDAYSTRCRTDTNCGSPDNDLYLDPSDPDQGYWYVVKVPPGGGGSTKIRVFDAQLTPGDLDRGAGDSSISGSNMSFTTSYRVYQQTNPLDFASRTPVRSGSPNQSDGSCSWAVEGQTSFRNRWRDLCTLNTVAGDIYLVNVRTSTIAGVSNSAGRNGYAIEACLSTGCTGGVQPALHAFGKMVMYNNISTGDATFYLAEVGPQYAGKTLVLELFDPGESSGTARLFPMRPSSTVPRPVVNVPSSDCDFESTRSGYPRSSDLNQTGVCSIRTANGAALYNGHWVTMRIAIPSSYTCTPGLDPEVNAGSCWWGMRYSFSGGGSPTDTTTWQARIEGNPVHLTQ